MSIKEKLNQQWVLGEGKGVHRDILSLVSSEVSTFMLHVPPPPPPIHTQGLTPACPTPTLEFMRPLLQILNLYAKN